MQVDSVGCHRYTDQPCARLFEQILQTGIHGIFHDHRITRAQQHALHQIKRLLASVRDQNLIVLRSDTGLARLVHQVMAQGSIAVR